MASSIATAFTLLMIPAAMIAVEDVKQLPASLRDRLNRRPVVAVEPPL